MKNKQKFATEFIIKVDSCSFLVLFRFSCSVLVSVVMNTMCTCALSILRLFSGTYDIQEGDVE